MRLYSIEDVSSRITSAISVLVFYIMIMSAEK